MHHECFARLAHVFAVLVLFIDGIGGLKYIACFKENSITDRLMKGAEKQFKKTLTKDVCMLYCQSKGMRYFGLQYSYECFCSHKKPSLVYAADENECDLKCDGAQEETCGGPSRLSVYDIEEDFTNVRYIGCYKEKTAQARLMAGAQKDFNKTLTNDKCMIFCKERHYSYSGTQFRFECFCSNERPNFKSSADEDECNQRCDGNGKETCGAGWRLSVRDIYDRSIDQVSSNYLGCYIISAGERNMKSVKQGNFEKLMTPEFCLGLCYRNGYRYAGAVEGVCLCGNTLDTTTKTNDTECDAGCTGDVNLKCGGASRISVYNTEIPDRSDEGRLYGCFEDNAVLRTLSGFQIEFRETNTPRLCLNICLQLGFKYSGVQYGIECYCGNRPPAAYLEKSENECSIPCPGDLLKMCGGGWRLLVFSTGESTAKSATTLSVPTEGATTPLSLTTASKTPSEERIPDLNGPISAPEEFQILGTAQRTTSNPNCDRSLTRVRGENVCKGQVLFYDDFSDSSRINKFKWTHEVIMPWTPDYEFVAYRKSSNNSFVKNRHLYIKPTFFDDDFVKKGLLELESCTGLLRSEECRRQAVSYNIIPPIESARLTSKDSMTFRYGVVQVIAKLPLGDWVVPEIWLEPKQKDYGTEGYASGLVRIAMARGNNNLDYNGRDIGNRQLEVGILMGVSDNIKTRTIFKDKINGWWRSFHNYTLIWTPDNLHFLVDGQDQESLVIPGTPLYQQTGFDGAIGNTWKHGTQIAPFDKEFYLTLGLSVGGMRHFPDGSKSSGHPKPWRNMAVKAMASFWQDRESWQKTWDDENSALQVKSVTITAL